MFCEHCGAPLSETAQFCAACGAKVMAAAEPQAQSAPQQASSQQMPPQQPQQAFQQQGQAGQQSQSGDFMDKVASINDTADTTGEYDPQDIAQNKGMSILAYISWLVFIPIIWVKDSPFTRFHCNQGLVLFLAEVAYGLCAALLVTIFSLISWRVGTIFSILFSICSIALLVLAILGIINAANGKAKELPVIGKIRILK